MGFKRKVVIKKHNGKQLKVLFDVPCETCCNKYKCTKERLYCKAWAQFESFGWYDIYKKGVKLRKLKT